jgi:hypothetical protein
MIFWQGKSDSLHCSLPLGPSLPKAGHPTHREGIMRRWADATEDLDPSRLISKHALPNTMNGNRLFLCLEKPMWIETQSPESLYGVNLQWCCKPNQPKLPNALNRYPMLHIGLFQLPLWNCAPNLVMSIISGLTRGMV